MPAERQSPWAPYYYYALLSVCVGKYFGLDDDAYESQVTDECLKKSAHQLPEGGTYQSQLQYTPYTVKMGQLTLYRSLSSAHLYVCVRKLITREFLLQPKQSRVRARRPY